MNYSKFKIEDFVQDEQFADWVKHPNTEGDVFWTNFVEQYPEQAENIAAAKDILLAIINQPVFPLSKEKENEILVNVNSIIDAKPMMRMAHKRWYWVAAASVAALVISVVGFLYWEQNTKNTEGGMSSVYQDMVDVSKVKMTEKNNNSTEPIEVVLSDGSRVTLQKTSKISYPEKFDGSFREVYLSGEAFLKSRKMRRVLSWCMQTAW